MNRERVEATPRKAMTDARKRQALEDYGKACATCGASLTSKVEFDHRIQLWMGGAESRANLQPLCIPCHKIKTAADAGERGHVKRIIEREDGTRRPRPKIAGQSLSHPTLTRGLDGKVKPKRGGGSATPHSGGSGRFLNENKGSDR